MTMLNLPSRNQIPEEQYTRIAVELLQTQNLTAILMLRKFLTHIPSPTCVKNILTAAITKLIDIAPAVVCWLLEYPDSLQPEIHINQTVIQILSNRLKDMGFVDGQDFCFTPAPKFEVSEAAQLSLSIRSQLFGVQDPSQIVSYLQKQS